LDDLTLSLLTNDEVLAVDQRSANNRPVFDRGGRAAWVADVPGSPDKYLALFNATESAAAVVVGLADIGLEGRATVRDLWAHRDLGARATEVSAMLPAHGAGLFRVAAQP